jgi:hypothetical protein
VLLFLWEGMTIWVGRSDVYTCDSYVKEIINCVLLLMNFRIRRKKNNEILRFLYSSRFQTTTRRNRWSNPIVCCFSCEKVWRFEWVGVTFTHVTSTHLTSTHVTSTHLTSTHLTSTHLTSIHFTSTHLACRC